MTSLGTGMWEDLSENNCKAQAEKHLVLGGDNLSWQQNYGQIPGGLVEVHWRREFFEVPSLGTWDGVKRPVTGSPELPDSVGWWQWSKRELGGPNSILESISNPSQHCCLISSVIFAPIKNYRFTLVLKITRAFGWNIKGFSLNLVYREPLLPSFCSQLRLFVFIDIIIIMH